MKKYTVVSIRWEDSSSSSGWEKPHKREDFVIRSFGILLRERKRSVTISTSVSKSGYCMDQLTIPRSAIRKMRKWKQK